MTPEELQQLRDSGEVVKQDLLQMMDWYNSDEYLKGNKLKARQKAYADMNTATKEKFRNTLKENFNSNLKEIKPGSVVDIIKSHHDNVTTQKNVMKRIAPFTSTDPELKKMTNNMINPVIEKGEKYLGNIKESIVQDGKIYNINALSDIFTEIQKNGNTKEVNQYMKNLLKGVDLSTIDTKQKEEFIKKTFRGDGTAEQDVLRYLGKIEKNFGIKQDSKLGTQFFGEMKDILNEKGNVLKNIGRRTSAVESIGKIFGKGANKLIKAPVLAIAGSTKIGSSIVKHVNQKSVNKIQKRTQKALKKTVEESNTLSDMMRGKKGMAAGVLLNSVIALGEYKEGRKEGKTVLGSAGDAAFSWAKGEVLGMGGMLALGAIKGAGSLAVKGTIAAMETSRSMNNLQRFTPFADAQFADNQQLATMRQSGMELAKMSQYNLQQTLMGTEAKYLHR